MILSRFKILKIIPISLILIWTSSFMKFASTDTPNKNIFQENVCNSDSCRKIASEILERMNHTVNPCDDFYEFVCGNYSKKAQIPEGESSLNTFVESHKTVQKRLKTSIDSEITKSHPKTFKILKSFYDSCLKKERNSVKEFLNMLKKFGGWPVLSGKRWKEFSFDWKRTIHRFRETGYSYKYFIGFSIDSDMKNISRRIIYLDQASLGISQEFLSKGLKDKVVQAYFKYMTYLAEIFGANREVAKKELRESLDFEIKLARISLSSGQLRNATALYNPMTVNEIQAKYPYVPWREYLNRLMSPYARLKADEVINVVVPSFFDNLGKLLSKTPKRVLANYAYWRVVQESAEGLDERVRKAQREFESALTGSSHEKPRWQKCLDLVSKKLYLATGALYVRNHFNKKSKDEASEMILEIKKTSRQMMAKADWMKNDTKKQALDKLDEILPLVAYPDELLDDQTLDHYHEDLKLQPDSFLKTILRCNLFSTIWELKRLRRPVLKTDWTSPVFGASSVVNAAYDPFSNTIQFPAGIFQGAFFNADHPKYMNYAGIGYVVGHEIIHGFDDLGRNFDKNGNMVNWWDSETEKKFLKKAECIINQYSNYTIHEVNMNIDGILTQGENIADNGGLKQAYYAYDAWQNKNGKEPRLPGLESYNSKQMFWMSAANVWCSKYRPERLINLIMTDPHSPAKYRVNGPISNTLEFAVDFSCPAGSAMNPTEKCSLW